MKKIHYNYFIIATYLIILSIIAPLWQWFDNLAIFDLNYMVEISNKISKGEKPYKDFILVLPPTTYLIQALIFKISGNNVFSIIIPSLIMNFVTSFFLFEYLLKNTVSKKSSLLVVTLYVLGSGFTLFPWLLYDNFILLLIFIYYLRHLNFKQNIYLDSLLIILCITTKHNVGIVFFILITLFDLFYLNKKLFAKKIFVLFLSFIFILLITLLNSIAPYEILDQLFLIPFEYRVNGDYFLNLSNLVPDILTERNFPRFILSSIMTLIFIWLIKFKIQNKYLTYILIGIASYIFIIYFHYGLVWYLILFLNIYTIGVSYPNISSKNIFSIIVILSCISGFVSSGPTGSSYATTALMILVSFESFKITKIDFLKKTEIKLLIIFLILGSALFQNFFNEKSRNNDYSSRFSKIELLFNGIKKENTYNYNIKELLKAKELMKYSNATAVNIPGDDALFFESELSNVLNYNQLYPPTTGLSYNDIVEDVLNKNPQLLFIKYTSKNEIIKNPLLANNELIKKGYFQILEKSGYRVYEKR